MQALRRHGPGIRVHHVRVEFSFEPMKLLAKIRCGIEEPSFGHAGIDQAETAHESPARVVLPGAATAITAASGLWNPAVLGHPEDEKKRSA